MKTTRKDRMHMNTSNTMIVRFGSCLLAVLMTGAGALFLDHAAPAAVFDTTGGTTVLDVDDPANTYIGNGVLQVSDDGSGLIELATGGGIDVTNFAMTGGSIIIDSGVTLRNGGWQKGVWTDNRASMNVGGTVDMWDGNTVFVDALNGSGTITKGYGGGTTLLEVGVLSGSGTFSGVIQNPQGHVALIKHGLGTQTLSGPQIAYTGSTTVHTGTLELRNTGNTFSSPVTVNAGGTLDLVYTTTGFSNRTDLAGPAVTGTGVININNAGSGVAGAWTTVNRTNTGRYWDFDGTININSGVLTRDHTAANTIRGTATVNVAAGAVFGAGRGGNSTIGALSGEGAVSTLWGGANAGSLTLGNGGASGHFSGTIHGNGTSGTDGTLEGGILSLIKVGTGTQTLSGNNTYTGDTTIHTGTLRLEGGAFSTTARSYSIAPGGVLNLHGNTGVASGTTTISGSGTLRVTGGTFANESPNSPAGSGRNITMAFGIGGHIDVQSGATMVNGGWQNITWTDNLASLTVNGTFDMWDGNTVYIDALNGSGTITKGHGGGTTLLELGVHSGSGTFSGAIQNPQGHVALVKHGHGTQTLSGPQIAYTGSTTVHTGTLVLSGATNYASATTAVHSAGPGGTLELHSTNPGVDNWRINTVLTGAGIINKTGSGWIQTYTNAHNFSGTFNIQEGTFGASYLTSNWSGVTADFHIAPGAVLDARGQAITVGSLNGGGAVGNTWVDTATLIVGAGNKSGTFSGIIHGNATSDPNNPANPNAGLLHLVKTGSGTQTLSGNNTFAGNVTVDGGVLRGSAPNAFGAANSARIITVNSGATLEFNQVGMYGGHNSAAVPHLVINAGGTVSNTSLNNPLNNVTLNGGTLTATASNTAMWRSWNINGTITSSGNSFITGGTAPDPGIMLQSAAVSNTDINVTGGNLTISAPIVDGRFGTGWPAVASSLTKLGGGVLYLDGSNSYSGNTHVNAGYLVARHSNALGAAGNSHVQGGATLQLENNITIANETAHIVGNGVGGTRGALASWTGNNVWGGPVVLTGDSRIFVNSGSMQINNTISQSTAGANLVKSGAGTLTLGGTSANTYAGTTTVQDAGVLQLNKPAGVAAIPGNLTIVGAASGNFSRVYTLNDNQFGANSMVHFQGVRWAILELLGTTQTVAGLTSDTADNYIVQNRQFGPSSPNDAHLILNGSGTYNFAGRLRDRYPLGDTSQGVLHLTMDGAGTQILSGNNTYTGTTNVTAGTLLVNGTHTGGGMYTVQAPSGGTATLGGTGTIGATVTIGPGGMHAPGASVGEQTVGDAVWQPGGAFEFEINNATGVAGLTAGGWDLLTISGEHGGGTLDIRDLTAGSFRIDVVSLDGAAPGSLANFVATQPRTWEFVTYDALLGEFDPGLFDLNVGPFTAHNNLGKGHFEIVQTTGGLAIGYVPEPGTWLLLLSALVCGLLVRRRK